MTIRLNVNVTDELNNRLDSLAERNGTTKSEMLRRAIALLDLAAVEKDKGNCLAIANQERTVLREIVGV
jgi:predicted transcriptional regulator